MKLKYSISYFIFIVAILIAFVYFFTFTNQYQSNQYAELEQDTEAEVEMVEIVLSNSDDVVAEGFYLHEIEGYIVVYLYDNITIYQETDIQLIDLNETLQEEVATGKYVENEGVLYAFLENYSS